jgi:two-component system sensor histidine kinase QseC
MPKGRSLRRRLTWYVVATLLVVTAASGVAVYQGTQHEADELFSAALVQTARILDGLISRESIEANRQQLRTALERSPGSHEYERNLFFAVFDDHGEMLLHSRRAPEIDAASVDMGFSEFTYHDKTWFTFALESSRDDLRIVVGERSGTRQEITEYIGGGLLLPLILLLPLVLWALWHIVGVALRPLEEAAEQVRRQNIRQLKAIDVDGVPLEIDPLVKALNRMIEDLDRAYARERRFVSDASHELRNPLASLLINVDNAIEESRDDASREALQSMKVSIKRLTHLVSQLLALSHFENPQSGRTRQKVDLCQVCRRVAATFEARAREADIEIELRLPDDGCELRGDEALLLSLVSNLVDNAVKYSGRGARIRVRCAREAERILLVVEDSGAGLDAAQREKAMQRFYRAADTNIAGAGLGLSIVKTIADIYGGSVELEESEFGGLAVRVRFEID